MNERILHIVFQKSESDIICRMRSLKPGTVNSTVNEILSAESKGKLAAIPYRFSSTNGVEKANYRFVIRTGPALDFVAKIPRGKLKQTLARVIRKHIRKSSELPPRPILIRGDYVVKLGKYGVNRNDIRVYDATSNKETRSFLILDDGTFGISSVNAKVLRNRANGVEKPSKEKENITEEVVKEPDISTEEDLYDDYDEDEY